VFDEDCPEDESINPCFTNSSSSYLDIVRNFQSKNQIFFYNSETPTLYTIFAVSEDLEEELCVFKDKKECVFKFSYYLDEKRKVRLKVLDSKVKTKTDFIPTVARNVIFIPELPSANEHSRHDRRHCCGGGAFGIVASSDVALDRGRQRQIRLPKVHRGHQNSKLFGRDEPDLQTSDQNLLRSPRIPRTAGTNHPSGHNSNLSFQ